MIYSYPSKLEESLFTDKFIWKLDIMFHGFSNPHFLLYSIGIRKDLG